MLEKNITIMKYKYRKGDKVVYAFEVMDKFDEPDEVERLDLMMLKSAALARSLPDYEQLWVKNTVIV